MDARLAPKRRDTRPSVCAVCGKPSAGLMVKDTFLYRGRPKYWGACCDKHAKMIKGQQGGTMTQNVARPNRAIVNEDSANEARKSAGKFIFEQSTTDVAKWPLEVQRRFITTIIRSYLNCEFDN